MGDYNDEQRRGYYGIGGGGSHGYEQGRRDRAADGAKWRGSPTAYDTGPAEGDGKGVIILLALVAIGAGVWTLRYLIGFVFVSIAASALALKLLMPLTRARITPLQAIKHSAIATAIAIVTAVALLGGAAAILMLGGPEIFPGITAMASDSWWQADMVTGNILSILTIPALLMLAAAVWWLDRQLVDGSATKAVRRLVLAAAMVMGPVGAAGAAVVMG